MTQKAVSDLHLIRLFYIGIFLQHLLKKINPNLLINLTITNYLLSIGNNVMKCLILRRFQLQESF